MSLKKSECTVVIGDKTFPCDQDLENAVIGAIVLESNAFTRIEDILISPDIFSALDNRIIFETVRQMYNSNLNVDILTVRNQLKSLGKLEEAGGDLCIVRKISNIASSVHLEFHARIIQQKWIQRQIMLQALQTYSHASDDTFDIADVIEELNNSIYNIQSATFSGQYPSLKEIIESTTEIIKANMIKGTETLGIPSGFIDLDAITLGFQCTDFIVIAARPAMGKTAFVGSISKYISVDQGVGCAVFSLEMSATQLMMRYFSLLSGIEFQDIRRGRLIGDQLLDYDRAVNRMIHSKLIVDDTPSLSIEEFRSKLKHMVRTQGVKIAFIDYLQLMTVKVGKFGNRQEEVSFISKRIKSIAKELNIPIIALSQLNRETEAKASDGVRPKLSNLRESGAIEQDADLVCFIHRPEYYGVKVESTAAGTIDWTNKAEIIIAKHRNGMTGSISLSFLGRTVQFANLI